MSHIIPTRIVIGRQRQRRLDIRLARGSITEANSESLVLGIFRDVTPSGAAQAVDQRLNGAIAEFSRRRMFSGRIGEVFVLPTGMHPVRAESVALVGLGAFDRFRDNDFEPLTIAAENVVRTFVHACVEDFATVLLGGASSPDPVPLLRALFHGAIRGLMDADTTGDFRRITLCETDDERLKAIREALYDLSRTELFDEYEVTIDEVTLPSAPETARSGLPHLEEAPAYLLVRGEVQADGTTEFVSSILTAGGKAAICELKGTVTKSELDAQLARVGRNGLTNAILDSVGTAIADMTLGKDFDPDAFGVRNRPLVIVHDAVASRIPWETLNVGGWRPALDRGMSRRYLAEDLSIAKWLEERRQDSSFRILLVVNPTEDLDGAEKEGERIRSLFSGQISIQIEELRGQAARKSVIEREFRSGRYDALHYAGHAFFDPLNPARSGILCAGGEVLSGADLAGISKLPSLVFFNACESGRTRKGRERARPEDLPRRINENVGLAEAFLRGGVANYIGTYWPVGDDPAEMFAERLYSGLIRGERIGKALLEARTLLKQRNWHDWADYILYGSPDFQLKIPGGEAEEPTGAQGAPRRRKPKGSSGAAR